MTINPLDRIRDQSEFYGRKARSNRAIYMRLKISQIVMAAVVPVLSLSPQSGGASVAAGQALHALPYIVAVFGATIGIIEAVLQLGQYQNNWLLYRATREALRREDFLYSAKAGPYAGQVDPDNVYVVRADAITSGENSKWVQQASSDKKQP